MHVFFHEAVTAGGWPDLQRLPSLVREGTAMRSALLADLLALADDPECKLSRVTITHDDRLEPPAAHPALTVYLARTIEEERELRSGCITGTDRQLIIAPETDGELERRVSELPAASSCNATLEAIRLCSDKLRTAELLTHLDLPTPMTSIADPNRSPNRWPVVFKPRDGAGSDDVFLLRSAGDWNEHRELMTRRSMIHQPFVRGMACSIAMIATPQGTRVLPPLRQRLSNDGRFRYLGGELLNLPAADIQGRWRPIADRLRKMVPGLRGYFGIDFIHTETGELSLVEINPRLTTSYQVYRELCTGNLAAWMQGE